MKHLGIQKQNTHKIHYTPLNEKTHITIMDRDRKIHLPSVLNTFIESILDEENPKRIVIFCTSLPDCGLVYRDIVHSYFGDTLQSVTQVHITNNITVKPPFTVPLGAK